MIENDQINSELAFQSKQVEDILQENIKLKEEIKLAKRKVDMVTQIEEELTKKNQSNQQIIKVLLGKLKNKKDMEKSPKKSLNEDHMEVLLIEKDSALSSLKEENGKLLQERDALLKEKTVIKAELERYQVSNNETVTLLELAQSQLMKKDLLEIEKIVTTLLLRLKSTIKTPKKSTTSFPPILPAPATKTYLDFTTPITTPLQSLYGNNIPSGNERISVAVQTETKQVNYTPEKINLVRNTVQFLTLTKMKNGNS